MAAYSDVTWSKSIDWLIPLFSNRTVSFTNALSELKIPPCRDELVNSATQNGWVGVRLCGFVEIADRK